MSSSQSQSLRYTASLALHQLDHLVSCFNRSRDDLKSVLQRLMTTEEQCARVTKLKMAIAKRSSLNGINASGGDRTLSQAQARVLEARDQLQSTLEQMSAIAGQINAMSCDISSKVGQISSDSALTAYSLGSDQAVFNYEYGELQRAAQIIKDQGRVLRSEVQVKIMQYKHCPVDQYIQSYCRPGRLSHYFRAIKTWTIWHQ